MRQEVGQFVLSQFSVSLGEAVMSVGEGCVCVCVCDNGTQVQSSQG